MKPTSIPAMLAAVRHSLTLRLALLFALLSFAALAGLGVALYHGLERELMRRDDAALVYRVEQLRRFLADGSTLDLLRTRPTLFENMLGNHESLLLVGTAGQPPLLLVNPGGLQVPDLPAVDVSRSLQLDDVHHLPGVDGVPMSALAVSIEAGELGRLQVITGRLMSERTAVLASYRLTVFVLAGFAALLLAVCGYVLLHRGLRPLSRLARHTRRIGVGNLGQRIDEQGAPLELRPMIEAFNTMLERLARGFAQLSQVSTDMAHELRTPINNLLGETQVALQQNRCVDDYQQLLASNVEELERLARMLGEHAVSRQDRPGRGAAPASAAGRCRRTGADRQLFRGAGGGRRDQHPLHGNGGDLGRADAAASRAGQSVRQCHPLWRRGFRAVDLRRVR